MSTTVYAAAHLARGYCPAGCGEQLAPGRKWCENHLRYFRERIQRRRIEAKARGVCQMCFRVPAAPGVLECRACLDKNRSSSSASKQRCQCACGRHLHPWYRRRGMACLRCQQAEGLVRTAREKSDYDRALRADRAAQGLCNRCGKFQPEMGVQLCEFCREERRALSESRRAARHAQTCPQCLNRRRIPGRRTCKRCLHTQRKTQQAARARRDSIGQCRRCESPARLDATICDECTRIAAIKRAA